MVCYEIYQGNYFLLGIIDGQAINQHSNSEEKRPNLPILLKNIK